MFQKDMSPRAFRIAFLAITLGGAALVENTDRIFLKSEPLDPVQLRQDFAKSAIETAIRDSLSLQTAGQIAAAQRAYSSRDSSGEQAFNATSSTKLDFNKISAEADTNTKERIAFSETFPARFKKLEHAMAALLVALMGITFLSIRSSEKKNSPQPEPQGPKP